MSRTAKGSAEYDNTAKPCPMGCKPVVTDRLKGNEMSYDDAVREFGGDDSFRVRVRVKKRKSLSDYGKRGASFDATEWYGFKKGF